MKLHTFKIGGVHPAEHKITADVATVQAPLPTEAIFPLSQHIGAPAKAVVAKGDKVKVGTLIAEAGGFVSAPIYSSVSGTVTRIDSVVDATGYRHPAIIIKVEGDEWEETIDRSAALETLDKHPRTHCRRDRGPREVGRYYGYGWCRLPLSCQALSAAYCQGRVRDTQRRGV